MERQAFGGRDGHSRWQAAASTIATRPSPAPHRLGTTWVSGVDLGTASPLSVTLVEQAVLDTAERLTGPALLLGAGLRVVGMSPLMEPLIRTGTHLTVRDDCLSASTAAGTAMLMRACAGLGQAADIPLTLSASRGSAVLHCAVTPLPAAAVRARSAACALLLVHAPLPMSDIALADAFGLTPAESDVARMLVEGLDISAVAARRGSAVNTVRNQVKSLLVKTGTCRQAELILKLRRY